MYATESVSAHRAAVPAPQRRIPHRAGGILEKCWSACSASTLSAGVLAACLLSTGLTACVPGEEAHTALAPDAQYTRIQWETLLPREWKAQQDIGQIRTALSHLEDNDPRATALLETMKKAWHEAPVETRLKGQKVRLPGFVLPLEGDGTQVRSFLLVPYFGACIHTPPPPANQMVMVSLARPQKLHTMDAVWISGTMEIVSTRSPWGNAAYHLQADALEPYKTQLSNVPSALSSGRSTAARSTAEPPLVLNFSDFFKLPAGPRGLEPSAALLAAHGKRVRLTGFMVARSRPHPGWFFLTPQPLTMVEDAPGDADDLPPAAVVVRLPEGERDLPVPQMNEPLQLTGTLYFRREEVDGLGRVHWLHLQLDASPTSARTVM